MSNGIIVDPNSDFNQRSFEIHSEEKRRKITDKSTYDTLREQLSPVVKGSIGFMEYAWNSVSGRNRTEFENLPEILEDGVFPNSISGTLSIKTLNFYNQNPAAHLDNIKSVDPNAVFHKDKYNNVIVTFGNGKQGYLNKPGISRRDAESLMGIGAIFKAIPLNKIVKFVKPIDGGGIANALRGSAVLGGVYGGVQIGSDLTATLQGSKQGISGEKLIWNVGFGVLGAPILSYGANQLGDLFVKGSATARGVAKKVSPGIFDPKKALPLITSREIKPSEDGFFGFDQNITGKGLEEAKKIGIDIENTDIRDLNIFANSLQQGADAEFAKTYMLFNKHGIDLIKMQVSRDPVDLANFEEVIKGTKGRAMQEIAIKFREKQNKQLLLAAQKLFKNPDITMDDLVTNKNIRGSNVQNQIGTFFQSLLRESENAANSIVDDNYKLIQGNLRINKETPEIFKNNIKNTLKAEYIDLELQGDMHPTAKSMLSSIEKFTDKISKKELYTDLDLREFSEFRKVLTNDIKGAKAGTDFRSSNIILNLYDEFEADVLDNALRHTNNSTGNERILQLLKARELSHNKLSLFGEPGKAHTKYRDYTAKWVHDTLFDNKRSGIETVQELMGFNYLKKPKEAVARIDRLYDVINFLPDSEKIMLDVSTNMKDGFYSNLFLNALSEQNNEIVFNSKKFSQNVSDFIDNDLGLEITNKILSVSEIEELREFAGIVKKTIPGTDFVNFSNTSSKIFAALEDMPVLGTMLKTGAYNLWSLKGLFTYRALTSMERNNPDSLNPLNNIFFDEDLSHEQSRRLGRSLWGTLYQPIAETLTDLEEKTGYKIDRVKDKGDLKKIQMIVTGGKEVESPYSILIPTH